MPVPAQRHRGRLRRVSKRGGVLPAALKANLNRRLEIAWLGCERISISGARKTTGRSPPARAARRATATRWARRRRRATCTTGSARARTASGGGSATSARRTTGATPGSSATRATATRRARSPSSATGRRESASAWKVRFLARAPLRLAKDGVIPPGDWINAGLAN